MLCERVRSATEVVAVEQPFAVPLIDQETGEVLERDLVGTLDLLERDAEGLVVVDLKTSARKYTRPAGRDGAAALGLQLRGRAQLVRGRR